MSARTSAGAEHLGVVEETEHEGAEGGAVETGNSTTTAPSACRSTTASSPSWSTTQPARGASDEHARVDRLVLAEVMGSART